MSDIKNVNYGLEKIFKDAKDFLPLLGTDYIEFYVGNAKQAAHYYKTTFGLIIPGTLRQVSIRQGKLCSTH